MSIFETIKNLWLGAKELWQKTPQYYTPFKKDEELTNNETNKVPLVNVHLNLAEGAINSLLGAVITQGSVAPGTKLANDITKIGAFLTLEGEIGALATASPSLGFIIAGLINKIGDVILGPSYRDLEYQAQWSNPNRLINVADALRGFYRGSLDEAELRNHLQKEGYDKAAQDTIMLAAKPLMGLGELINLRFRGVIATDEDYYIKAAKLGYDKEEARLAMESGRPLTSPSEAIAFYRRGFAPIKDGDPFDDMRKAGWSEERIAAIKGSSHSLPNIFEIQDFTVRQVDDPEIVNKFKLDAFIDEKYFAKAKELGYTREDAQRIYRYYWNVPSFFVLRQLYSEGKLTEQDFRDLLSFSRFTPYWVDKLSSQLKPQLTQGEIKDMYKYQVITEGEIVPELVKIGTAPDLAERLKSLWTASVKLATPLDQTDAQTSAAKIKTDTLTLIKTAYKDGVLNKADALDHLAKINYSTETAEMELSIADYELHQAGIKDKISYLKDEVAAGVISSTDAITQLSEAGATADQLSNFSLDLFKASQHKPRTPTLAEFESWYKKKLISSQQLYTGLGLLGISDVWAPYYLLASGVPDTEINSLITTA